MHDLRSQWARSRCRTARAHTDLSAGRLGRTRSDRNLGHVRNVTAGALANADLTAADIASVGITNQRETAVVWERATGKPVYNAIVWQDTRTDRICTALAGEDGPRKYTEVTGLPLATYFSGPPKVKWILDNVEGASEKAEAGELCFGTMDTWVLWNMTGGVDGGVHATDPTNASRTLLMDLDTLAWDSAICADMGIPESMLPEIRSSSETFGFVRERGTLSGVPIAGILGDQQAATFGQACLSPGEAKNTYGTGNFVLLNTGTEKVMSKNGLLTTVCYKIGEQPTVYALEGSIAVTGSLVQWLRDNLGMIDNAADIEVNARSVDDNGGAYFVPAFSGLFAPHWRADARGAIVGLTRFVNKGHLARAVLEATAYQSREVIEAMNLDSGVDLKVLKVDGGMVANELLMQFQADLLDVEVIRLSLRRPRHWALRTPLVSRSGTGRARTTFAATGRRTRAGRRRWIRPSVSAVCRLAESRHSDTRLGRRRLIAAPPPFLPIFK